MRYNLHTVKYTDLTYRIQLSFNKYNHLCNSHPIAFKNFLVLCSQSLPSDSRGNHCSMFIYSRVALEVHINGIIYYVHFCIWLLLHTVTCINSWPLLLMTNKYSIVWIWQDPLLKDIWVVLTWAIMNNAAVHLPE